MTYNDILAKGMTVLENAGIAEYRLDAELLFEFVFGMSRASRLTHGQDIIIENDEMEDKISLYSDIIEKRKMRIPLQHLTGSQEFMGLDFKVNKDVLIPRMDTEVLVEEALKNINDGMRILDMCTGSGCILISLINYSNGCYGLGADISSGALEVAKENASRLLKNKSNVKVEFVQSDLFSDIPAEERFDLIISNPPYIATAVIDSLEDEVKKFDPMLALDGGEDGLFFYRQIISDAKNYLIKGGRLLFEIGYDQAESVSELLSKEGYKNIYIIKDYAGLDRVVSANKSLL